MRNWNAGSCCHSLLHVVRSVVPCSLSVRLSYTCTIFHLTVTALKRRKLRPKRIQGVNENYISSLYFPPMLVFILWSDVKPQMLN